MIINETEAAVVATYALSKQTINSIWQKRDFLVWFFFSFRITRTSVNTDVFRQSPEVRVNEVLLYKLRLPWAVNTSKTRWQSQSNLLMYYQFRQLKPTHGSESSREQKLLGAKVPYNFRSRPESKKAREWKGQGANLLGRAKRLGTGELLQMTNINVFLFSKMCSSIMASRKQHFVVYWALTLDID